jgi:hypothetical protein
VAATEEPLEQEEDSAPQGPVSDKYRARTYAGDRRLARLRQWFAPLPSRHKVPPLERPELRDTAAEIQPDNAAQLLEEAKTVWDGRVERIRAAEAKATTLLGTVAIAASLVIAGSGLILDPSKVTDDWRVVLMVVVALLKVVWFSRPQVSQALQRAKETDPTDAQTSRAVDLMARAGQDLYVADYKVAQVRIAYRWYRLALLFFLILGVALAAYVLLGDLPATSR